jgi:hypothetical protein
MDDFGLGRHSGNSSFACGRHPLRDLVQSVAEQVAVLVERHRRSGVPEHLLETLTSAPEAMARDAAVCRSSWVKGRLRPALSGRAPRD